MVGLDWGKGRDCLPIRVVACDYLFGTAGSPQAVSVDNYFAIPWLSAVEYGAEHLATKKHAHKLGLALVAVSPINDRMIYFLFQQGINVV